ncbi:MAG: uroporphyrinogen decarboxylase family protein [Phycisphaerae bacterium]
MTILDDINRALENLKNALASHPERRMDLAEEYILRGQPRPYPVIGLAPGAERPDPDKPISVPPNLSPLERLLNCLYSALSPLEKLNPIYPVRRLGISPANLAASFGFTLDPATQYSPHGRKKTMDEVVSNGIPDPEKSGILPEIFEDLETTLALTPEWFKIAFPDMQGPFNLAHMILGNDALTSPYDEPEKFHAAMTIITDFFLAVSDRLEKRIGVKRLPKFPSHNRRIAECSVNLVSPRIYEEHILPQDLRIAEHFGQVAIHPCSGPHVFYATLRNLPVIYTEAGYIAKQSVAAGAISVEYALAEIGDRAIILSIGQELPVGSEFEFICRDLDRARDNPRLLFGYCGMHWTSKDWPAIMELHRRIDDYWEQKINPVAGENSLRCK